MADRHGRRRVAGDRAGQDLPPGPGAAVALPGRPALRRGLTAPTATGSRSYSVASEPGAARRSTSRSSCWTTARCPATSTRSSARRPAGGAGPDRGLVRVGGRRAGAAGGRRLGDRPPDVDAAPGPGQRAVGPGAAGGVRALAGRPVLPRRAARPRGHRRLQVGGAAGRALAPPAWAPPTCPRWSSRGRRRTCRWPAGFAEAASGLLVGLGVPPGSIRVERFRPQRLTRRPHRGRRLDAQRATPMRGTPCRTSTRSTIVTRAADGHEGPARRQGRQPGRDDLGARLPVPPARSPPTPAGTTCAPAGRRPHRRGRPARRQAGEGDEARLGDPSDPATRPLGREVLDARDDGHRPQPGPQRPQREGSRPRHLGRALRLRLLPALHRPVRPHRAGPR